MLASYSILKPSFPVFTLCSFKMAAAPVRRVLSLILFILVQCIYSQEYKIPPVRIQVFKPKGFRASIAGEIVDT